MASVGDQADRRTLVQEEGEHGPGERALGGLIAFQRCVAKRAPASRAAPRGQVVGPRVAERGDDPGRGQPLDGEERAGQLGRQRDEADEAALRPLVDGAEIDRRQLPTGIAPPPAGSGRAPRDAVRGRGGRPPPRPSSWRADSRDARRGQPGRVVDLQVDEAGEDERRLGSSLPPLDRGDDSVLDDELPGEGALDRVNEKSL